MRVEIVPILRDRLIEKREDVFVEQRGQAFVRRRNFLLDLQQLLGRRGEIAADLRCRRKPYQCCSEHQRIVASRGRSTPWRTNSRTRLAMPSGCKSYCARSTSCVP